MKTVLEHGDTELKGTLVSTVLDCLLPLPKSMHQQSKKCTASDTVLCVASPKSPATHLRQGMELSSASCKQTVWVYPKGRFLDSSVLSIVTTCRARAHPWGSGCACAPFKISSCMSVFVVSWVWIHAWSNGVKKSRTSVWWLTFQSKMTKLVLCPRNPVHKLSTCCSNDIGFVILKADEK